MKNFREFEKVRRLRRKGRYEFRESRVKEHAGENAFSIGPQAWTQITNAAGIFSKSGRRIEGRRVGVREDAHTFYKKCAEARGDMGRNTFYKKCAEAPRSFGTECLTFSASFNIVAIYGIGCPRITRMDTNRGCRSGMGVI